MKVPRNPMLRTLKPASPRIHKWGLLREPPAALRTQRVHINRYVDPLGLLHVGQATPIARRGGVFYVQARCNVLHPVSAHAYRCIDASVLVYIMSTHTCLLACANDLAHAHVSTVQEIRRIEKGSATDIHSSHPFALSISSPSLQLLRWQ